MAMGCGLSGHGFDYLQGQDNFFSTAFGHAARGPGKDMEVFLWGRGELGGVLS
jgi:hypothetical protein